MIIYGDGKCSLPTGKNNSRLFDVLCFYFLKYDLPGVGCVVFGV